jgi:phosphomannomutase/phosphoglucomutase
LLAHQQRRQRGLHFDVEGVTGTYLNDFGAKDAWRVAAALGMHIREEAQAESDYPTAVIASDGRPWTGNLLAAASEGLRYAGCKVVDIGYATAPCVAFAVDHLRASGGLLIGNGGSTPQAVRFMFWAGGTRPLSAGGQLDTVQKIVAAPVTRPLRKEGSVRRFRADVPYLACLRTYFHALRPLRLVVDTASEPLKGYLNELSDSVACEIVYLGRRARGEQDSHDHEHLADAVAQHQGHFGVWIDGDGEVFRVVDDRRQLVDSEQVSLLLTNFLLQDHPRAAVVIEQDSSAAMEKAVRAAGADVHRAEAARETMYCRLRDCRGLTGGGPSGRVWFQDHQPSADALKALALLLNLLSQSDRDLSEVLDNKPR